ncbi:MAG: T9SS type A sorting domain-containing protein [bacterium]|nr:T9SS type A sorting domain-containing protein [bacterium]
MSATGDSMWSRTFGTYNNDQCFDVQLTADGGFALAGYMQANGSGNDDFALVKTDANGNQQWRRTFRGSSDERCYAVQQTSDGGYLLAGGTESYGSGNSDFWLVKTNSNGDSLWSRTFGGGNYERCYSAQQTSDGGYVLAGSTNSFGAGGRDFWLVKTNASGNMQWSRTFGRGSDQDCMAVRQTSDGGYVLAGIAVGFTYDNKNFWMVKTNSNGDSVWSRLFGSNSSEECYDVLQTPDGGYVLAGFASFGGNGFWMVKTNSNGDSLWSRMFHGGVECRSIQRTADGCYVLAGRTQSFGAGFNDFWIVKTGPELDGEGEVVALPSSYALAAYPNPFNAATTLEFAVPKTMHVTIRAFDILGREAARIEDAVHPAGTHRILWDAEDCASGVYLVSMTGEGTRLTRKVLLVR